MPAAPRDPRASAHALRGDVSALATITHLLGEGTSGLRLARDLDLLVQRMTSSLADLEAALADEGGRA